MLTSVSHEPSIKTRIIQHLAVGTGFRIAFMAVSFATIMYLSRRLGPASYGLLNVGTSLVGYASLLMTMGFPTIGTREVALKRETAIWKDIFLLRVILTIPAFVVLLLVVELAPAFQHIKGVVFVLSVGMLVTALMPDWLLVGQERIGFVGFAMLLGNVVTLVLTVVLVESASHTVQAALAAVLGQGVAAFVMLYKVSSEGLLKSNSGLSMSRLKTLLSRSAPFLLSSLSSQVYGSADMILLNLLRGPVETGLYAAAYKPVNALASLYAVLSQATYPVFVRMLHGAAPGRKHDEVFVLKVTVGLLLPVTIGGTLLAKPIMVFAFGNLFASAALPLSILLWYAFISAISVLISNLLLARGRDAHYVGGIGLGAISDILLDFILIPKYGMVGAASAMVLSECLILLYLLYRNPGLRLVTQDVCDLVVIVVISLIMAVVINYAQYSMGLWSTILCGVVTYITLLASWYAINPKRFMPFGKGRENG